jgi:methionyl aminopeptidase
MGCKAAMAAKVYIYDMTVRNPFELDKLRRIGQIVAETLHIMKNSVEEGMTTKALDAIGAANLRKYGAVSAPMKTYKFPGATCISINDEIAHGIPSDRKIKRGDFINLDVSAELDGFYADTGYTFVFGEPVAEIKRLCECSKRALDKAVHAARAGEKFNRIGRIIENEARSHGFETIKNLTGHGTGSALHEFPDHLLNYYDPRQKGSFSKGMVVAIETFVSTGADHAEESGDGWTLTTSDMSFVAQYEHSLVVTDKEPIILTQLI